MKKTFKAHVVDTKDIVASWDNSFFKDSIEQNIDDASCTIKDVCVFGSRHSKNGYTYNDQAISSLSKMTHGARFFIDHPSSIETKERDGVRSLHSWAGMFTNSHQQGEKVFADLVVRESFWPLVKDVAIMKPTGIGNSINSRVKVYKDDKGNETILDIDVLKSIDLVASAATTSNLWESVSDDEADKEEIDKEEGILKDRIKARETIRAVNKMQWDASDVIDEILRDKDKKIPDKKKEISSVLDDLESEINKIMGGKVPTTDSSSNEVPETPILSQTKENEMDFKDLSLETLSKERPDLVNDIKATLEDAERIGRMESDLQAAITKVEELNTSVEELKKESDKIKKENDDLKKENDDLKKKVDEYETKGKKIAKEAMIATKLEEAKLPKDAVSDVFVADLMLKDEEGIDASIKDRQGLWNTKTAGVKGSGDEFVDNKTESDKESAAKSFKESLK